MADARTHEDPSPSWPTCLGRGAGPGRQCRGKQAEGFEHCLAHLEPGELDQVLRRLRPGGDLDASGTPVNGQLLAQILQAVRGDDERPSFGEVSFTEAHFTEDAGFDGVRFGRNAGFTGAVFTGDASFIIAEFGRQAVFDGAQFSGGARFGRGSVRVGSLI
jgi:Pentapeptide repeats (9 copies)